MAEDWNVRAQGDRKMCGVDLADAVRSRSLEPCIRMLESLKEMKVTLTQSLV